MISDAAPPPTGWLWRWTLIVGWSFIAFGVLLILDVWRRTGLRGTF